VAFCFVLEKLSSFPNFYATERETNSKVFQATNLQIAQTHRAVLLESKETISPLSPATYANAQMGR